MEYRKITKNNIQTDRIKKISKDFSISEKVAEVLLARGFESDEAISKFLSPSLDDLHNPMLLDDMKEAVDKIKKAISEKKRILIFGDYDVDGISASYILLDYFESLGAIVDAFLPNRYIDGYGLTIEALDKEIARFSPDLIITVDCGITGYKEVEYIKSFGIDVIITDHHNCPEILPDCLVIDAKKPNQKYPFNEICGTGVAFKIVEAMSDRKTALKYLPITALATVADIVPLVDENRAIVKFGLSEPLSSFPLGIAMLAKELKISGSLTSQDVGFKLAPKINAAGRMGNAKHSLDLYRETDKTKITQMIAKLLVYNTDRQELCNIVYRDCVEELKKVDLSQKKTIVLYNQNWNIGILGIVAARISEEYNRPTFLLGKEGELYKGSCRSIEGMDIHSILTKLNNTLESFGGHTMAAGISVREDKLNEFSKNLESIVNSEYDDLFFKPYYEYDLEIELASINPNLIADFSKLEPFGCGNPMPIFKIIFDKCVCVPMKNSPQHLTVQVPPLTLLCFNKPEFFNMICQSSKKECLVELQIENYKGSKNCKGIIKYIQLCECPNISAERIGGEYIKQLALSSYCQKPIFKTYNKNNLDELLSEKKSIYGTLIVANTLQSYKEFLEKSSNINNILCFEYLNLTNKSGFNTLCLCPSSLNDFTNFNRIILLDSVLDDAYITSLNSNTKADIYLPQNAPFLYSPFKMIDLSRKIFGKYFNLIKEASNQKIIGFDDFNLFNKLKKIDKTINYVQFISCLFTFSQIGIIKIQDKIGEFGVFVNNGNKSSLEKSFFYNKLCLVLKSY
ncbi:MAG: single-stranded-DNA-specific exonuclease RecJ [Clostridia bacterium]|nr:single-stranded-DNA-specific exonuclease RecJ [Clostridia bacterium]